MSGRRFFVRQVDGFWTFGPDGKPYEAFESKEAAIRTALKFVMQHPEIELVIEDKTRRRKKSS